MLITTNYWAATSKPNLTAMTLQHRKPLQQLQITTY